MYYSVPVRTVILDMMYALAAQGALFAVKDWCGGISNEDVASVALVIHYSRRMRPHSSVHVCAHKHTQRSGGSKPHHFSTALVDESVERDTFWRDVNWEYHHGCKYASFKGYR